MLGTAANVGLVQYSMCANKKEKKKEEKSSLKAITLLYVQLYLFRDVIWNVKVITALPIVSYDQRAKLTINQITKNQDTVGKRANTHLDLLLCWYYWGTMVYSDFINRKG